MNHQELERSFISLRKRFVDIKVYIKEHFNKDGLLRGLLLEFERPYEEGLLENIKQLERLDELDIPIDSVEVNRVEAIDIAKKYIKNKRKFNSIERAPYYSEGDVITDLVEKVLRNIIRTN